MIELEEIAVFALDDFIGNENEDFGTQKLKTAVELCWDMPQLVNSRIFSAKRIPTTDKYLNRLNVLYKTFSSNDEGEKINSLEIQVFENFSRVESNASLIIASGFSTSLKSMFAVFWQNRDDQIELLPTACVLQLSKDYKKLTIHLSSPVDDSGFGLTRGWFEYGLGRKVAAWLMNPDFEVAPSGKPRSMRLVDPEVYLKTYINLKSEIGQYWVQNWPERTDPYKFVFEELAIAAYFVAIVRRDMAENETKQVKFADLGCGNGFLTYALNNLHCDDLVISGIGIDARRRNIWSIYPGMSNLLIEAPVSTEKLDMFQNCEWFIGNHSDELTPWIPYIASKVGPNTKVFLLPCCPFDFHGKYKFRHAGLSLYGGYLDFIEDLCRLCGFEVERDRLRIPSTKRVCFICTKRREISQEEQQENEIKLQQLVGTSNLLENPPVPKAPEIRNCTAIAPALKKTIIAELFALLLECDDGKVIELTNGKEWKIGRVVDFSEAITSLGDDAMEAMKNQDGGLKTFIKNHPGYFTVIGKGFCFRAHPAAVEFMASRRKKPVPRTGPARGVPSKAAAQPCPFEQFHPDGCPFLSLEEPLCRSAHSSC